MVSTPESSQEVKNKIVDALCIIFNESIIRHEIPADWKNAYNCGTQER